VTINPQPLLRRIAPVCMLLAFVALACSLVGNDKPTQKFSFNKSYDTLAKFDSVVITLRDTSGKTIDILYRGKADTIHEIENLPAPHWNGEGIAIFSIVGFDSGEVVYHVDIRFNGKNDRIYDTVRVILPHTLLAAPDPELILTEGDSVPFRAVAGRAGVPARA
jgi:hypothetical protein